MSMFLFILAVLVYAMLVVTTAVRPQRSGLSRFELDRLKERDERVKIDIIREACCEDIVTWQRIKSSLLLVVVVLLLITSLGWIIGILVAVVAILQYSAIARLSFVQSNSQKLYIKIEPFLLDVVTKYGPRLSFLRGLASDGTAPQEVMANSREELLYIVEQSGKLLSTDEKKLMQGSLAFAKTTVESVMTPRSVVDSIGKDELLGPLTLDELHKTGHSRFPVVDGDIDHVVGVLHLRDLISLKEKKSVKASVAMKSPVYYIKDTQTLQHALAAFLKTHHLLFVVVNEYRETVGVITLEDVLEVLLGQKIMDEFDAHEDLRKVAARNPKSNNLPDKHHNV